jgi:hypothetical protein
MGLPLALDGLPDRIRLRKAVECPICKRQVSIFIKKVEGPNGHITTICSLCKNKIPETFVPIIKARLRD